MLILIKLIALATLAMGLIFILNPQLMKQFVASWGQGKRLYIVGVLRILIAILFLMAASQCKMAWILVTIGVLALVGGIIIFILGLERCKFILGWWDKKSIASLRIFAIILIIIGWLIFNAV